MIDDNLWSGDRNSDQLLLLGNAGKIPERWNEQVKIAISWMIESIECTIMIAMIIVVK